MGYQILIADDEAEIRELLRLYLEKDGYRVFESGDGLKTLEILKTERIDLLLLDIMMPEMDGFAVLKKLRRENNIPVLIMSAKDADSDKILGLDLGADDYLTKPMNPLEAVARVNSNIRRFYTLGVRDKEEVQSILQVRDLKLDLDGCVLYKEDQLIELTSVEYRIMRLFLQCSRKGIYKGTVISNGVELRLYGG